MVSLTNQARLLAAQEFNRRVLEQKAAEGKRISTTSKRVGVLTGRVAKTDKSGRVVGVTRTKSKTRLNTEKLLRAEIKRQQELRAKETDLERFLKGERRIATGRISRAELNRQIAERKRKGLSKTPAQRRALSLFTKADSLQKLQARNVRKTGRGRVGAQITSATTLQSILASEEARAGQLGSAPFTDPLFGFGGRTRAEVVRRGGTFGRRAGGESLSQQLGFVTQARKGTASARISFAQSLLGDSFGRASREELLSVVGSQVPSRDPKKRARGALTQIPLAPPTFEQVLRQGQGFFTTRAVPVTKPKITKRERKLLVKTRKAEDFAKASAARKEIARRPRQTGQTVDDLERTIGVALDARNLARAQREFGFGAPRGQFPQDIVFAPVGQDIRVRGFQAIDRAERVPKGKKLTPTQRRRQAEARQRETERLRAERQAGFPAFGRTFGQEEIFRPSGQQEPIPALTPAGDGRVTVEGIRVRGQRITEPARQPPRDRGIFGNIFGGLQSFLGGAPLIESERAGVRIETGEAVGGALDFFRPSEVGVEDVVETGRGLARGELLEGITIGEALGESPLGRDNPLANFFSFR